MAVEKNPLNCYVCCICGERCTGWGNNPYPVTDEEGARCCDECNNTHVIPARIAAMYANKEGK